MNFVLFAVAGLLQAGIANAPTVQSRMDKLATSAARCQVPEAYFTQFTDEPRLVRVLVPRPIWKQRKEPEVAQRLNCIAAAVAEQGFRPLLLGTRR
ncbi:MAG TPA: hypothetical protein VGB70_05945 [Allosphingosinicella sp.]|jgi:hypothetical protein